VFNATFNNISVISWRQFYWWRISEYLEKTTDIVFSFIIKYWFNNQRYTFSFLKFFISLDSCIVFSLIIKLFFNNHIFQDLWLIVLLRNPVKCILSSHDSRLFIIFIITQQMKRKPKFVLFKVSFRLIKDLFVREMS
jgi:hypothetical protein